MSLSLNDITYEIYLEYIIELLGFKEIAVLSMVSKTLKEIFDHNDIWKELYFKLNPPTIVDHSIHIGNHKKDKYLDYGSILKKYDGCRPCYWTENETIYSSFHMSTGCCNGLEGLIEPLNKTSININYTKLYIKDQSESVREAYYNLIKNLYIKKTGLNPTWWNNLCRNPNHYIQETLHNNRKESTCISFKKLILLRLQSQIKDKNKSHKSNLTRKTKSFKLLEQKMKILQEEMDNINSKSTKYTQFTEKSTESIDLLTKQFGKTKISYDNTTSTKINEMTVICPKSQSGWSGLVLVRSPNGRKFKTRVPLNVIAGQPFKVEIPRGTLTLDIDGGYLLSAPWLIHKSEEYNRWYYYNLNTKISQWERPSDWEKSIKY